ncbi:MAG: hypothetical protein CL904_03305 [Dehalococcoidia bacterium]|nr:hypothetical protein [Dehalococcoidia bacterium]MQG15515.1 DUF3105 domain-containing protein [SAR202 cluster bacterium]|tara:strand:+ start:11745 stop:13022 length:1278 start_codon:yes stop_codon:yes gene_type:complete
MKTLYAIKRILTSLALIMLIIVTAINCSSEIKVDLQVETDSPHDAPAVQEQLDSGAREVLSVEDLVLSKEELDDIKEYLNRTFAENTFRYSMDAIIKTDVAGIEVTIPISILGEYQPQDKAKAVVSINMGFVDTDTYSVSSEGKLYFADSINGKWTSSEDTGQIFSSPTVMLRTILNDSGPLEVVSRENLADSSLLHVKVSDLEALFGNIDNDIQVDLWIEEEQLQLYKLTLEGPIYMPDIKTYLPSQIDAREATLSATYEFSGFRDAITVDVPEAENYLVNGKLPGTKVFEQVNLVIAFGESHPEYKSTPATSGWHYGQPDAPAPWGVHDEFIPDEVLLQNLVQGGIGLHYNCEKECRDVVDVFTKFAEQYPKIIVSPYSGMDQKIAITAWSYIDEMDEIDIERIELFIKAHHNSERAPEHFKP